MTVLLLIVVVALVVVVGSQVLTSRSANTGTLTTVATLIGGQVDRSSHAATGSLAGHPFVYRNIVVMSEETTRSTELAVTVPPQKLELEIRTRSKKDDKDIAAGRAVDVDLGDPVFRDRYVAEGAPADAVRALLGPEVRRLLLAAKPFKVGVGDGTVHIETHFVTRDEEAIALVKLADALARALPSGAAAGATSQALAEHAALAAARGARQRRNFVLAGVVTAGLIAGAAYAFLRVLKRRASGPPNG